MMVEWKDPPARKTSKKKPDHLVTKRQAIRILDTLEKTHPDARTYLDYGSPFQLLIATILSAQCTDAKVNEITPALFEKYPTPADFAAATQAELERELKSTGFFRKKAERVRTCSRIIAAEHGGEVPGDMAVLTEMEGVGRKTASVVLGEAFDVPAIAVDTHVQRVSTRLGLATGKTPDKIEKQLCEIIPEGRWTRATQLIGTHGRRICSAKKPDHENCPVRRLCAFYKELQAGGAGK
jgi:endonuclease-3